MSTEPRPQNPKIPPDEAVDALRERSLPTGALHGLYDAVLQRAESAPGGGGMSLAFLDAPRSLRLWRGAALAASVLLVVAAGIILDQRFSPSAVDHSHERVLSDPRAGILPVWNGSGEPIPGFTSQGIGDVRFWGIPSVPADDGDSQAGASKWN
jgi:hypothetical protein